MIENQKLYPLTTAQKMHFFTLKYCPKKQILNIGTSLTIETDIDFNALREAIYKAYDRCEAMRIRLVEKEDGELYQYIAEKETRYIEHVDFSNWLYDDAEAEMRKWTEQPFERYNSPLNKVVMITMPDGYSGLYLCVDHMTMDSYSIIMFYRDIIEIYCSLKFEYPYPKERRSYIKAVENDLNCIPGTKLYDKDFEYWSNYIKESEPIYTDILGPGRLEAQRREFDKPHLRAANIQSGSVDACISKFHLEPDPTYRLMKFCEDNNLPMVCLLMMGIRTYLSKVNNKESDVSIKTTVARRATLLDKLSGGTRIYFYPCRTIVNMDDTFIDGIKIIQARQNTIFKHSNLDPISIINMYNQNYDTNGGGYECMSLTYQPLSLKAKNELTKEINYKSRWYSNGVAACPIYLTVMHNPLDNGMDFYFEYQKKGFTWEQLQHFYYYLCRILFKGIENPYNTVESIIDEV